MLNVYFAFEGATANVLSYFGNTEKAIAGLNVTRTAAGQYTCVFLSGYTINPNQQPIIQLSPSGPTGTAGICNVISSSVVFIPTNGIYPYQITLAIETYAGTPLDPAIMMVAYAQP
jgi:hypothetical protein